MLKPLNILYLEDDPHDATLVQEALKEAGIEGHVQWVSSQTEFMSALEQGDADLVLSDYALPQFDGLSALALVRGLAPDTPFILVSGTLGEDAAIESLRSGATDYVLKTRLSRLAPAVRRAVDESEGRKGRRAIELALERERNFLRALLDSLDAGVVACDQDGILTLFNRATRELYGLPEDSPAPEGWTTHYRLTSPDGKTPLDPEASPLARALRGEQFRQAEITILRQDGSAHVAVASGQPIMGDGGTRLGAVVTMQDVTEQRDLERQLRQSQRMEAMGKLAAGIAHDFNNLLTVINGYCDLARSRHPAADPAVSDLDEIARAGQRAADLIRQLLAFSRQQVLEPRALDLNAVVGDTERMLRRLIGADVEVIFKPGKSLEKIHADAGQVEQVLLNLIVNARDAMPQGGLITIETANIDVDPSGVNVFGGGAPPQVLRGPLWRTPAVVAGEYVALTVTDTGSGMDAETASRIFEPFFTTKEPGRGTGLGLSTVHGIVTQSGGYIAVHSEPGMGARFRVYLPRAENLPEAEQPLAPVHPPGRGTETILVIDDDSVIVRLVKQILEARGYVVLEAGGGQAALTALADPSCTIDAIVTDVVMPGLSGREVAQKLKEFRPELPILFMSGYLADDADRLGSLLGSRVAFIQKPFTPEMLLTRVRDVLDGSAADKAA